jgi:hypothetical protein
VQTLSTTQRQLHKSYHNDRFLKDQIVIAVDIPEIERSLRGKEARTSHEVIQRVTALLSNEPRSAGAHFTIDCEHENDGYYGAASRYGEEAKRKFRWKGNGGRKPSGLKCWVCQKPHRARDHHSRDEIKAAFDKRRKEEPKAVMLVEDVSDILYGSESSCDKDDEEDDVDSGNIVEPIEVSQKMERNLANVAFCAGRGWEMNVENMHAALSVKESQGFDGIINYRLWANRSSITSISQYRLYCEEFGVAPRIDPTKKRPIKGIGGRRMTIGCPTIPIPLSTIGITITVDFQIIEGNVPSLLSLADVKRNMLDVKMLENRIEVGGKSQPLTFENGFLVHKWKNSDVFRALYTEAEVRKLHRSFGHPCVGTAQSPQTSTPRRN